MRCACRESSEYASTVWDLAACPHPVSASAPVHEVPAASPRDRKNLCRGEGVGAVVAVQLASEPITLRVDGSAEPHTREVAEEVRGEGAGRVLVDDLVGGHELVLRELH